MICKHCGQELQKASIERKEIQETQLQNISDVSDALGIRQDKLDHDSEQMLAIVQRIEKKLGADPDTLQEVKELERKIRDRVLAQYNRENSND